MINKEIKDYLELLDIAAAEFDISVNPADRYNSIVSAIKKLEPVKLSTMFKEKLFNFAKGVDIPEEENTIFGILYPGVDYTKADDSIKELCTIENLNDTQLFKLFKLICTTVSSVQFGDFLLMKYTPAIFNTGWTKLTQVCRGKVINLATMDTVVYPFDKFFNLNEIEDNTVEELKAKIAKASAIEVTEKKDGSLIILTNVDGYGILCHTKGAIDNEHAKIATKLFRKKYSAFWDAVPKGYTFMFELISEADPHIIKYKDEQLCLLSIRELNTLRLFAYSELCDFAKTYELDVVPQHEFKSLDEFIERAQNAREGIEGWVIRIRVPGEPEHMFKLKTEEYLALRRIANTMTLLQAYRMSISGELNTLLEKASPELQDDIATTLEEIDILKIKGCEAVAEISEGLLQKYGLKFADCRGGNISEDKKPIFLKLVKEAQSHVFVTQILRYIKRPENKYNQFDRCKIPMFKKLLAYFDCK